MAILKGINRKDSGWLAMGNAIDYCHNPQKIRYSPPLTLGISSDPKKAFSVNKNLHHQGHRKRLFKSFVVSMEATWPDSATACAEYEQSMEELMFASMEWLAKKGYQTTGAVHSNTEHPHFHLEIDTCNVFTGKQFSQSIKELTEFKNALSKMMETLGLGETILQQKTTITEASLYEEDELNDGNAWLFREEDQHTSFDESKSDFGPAPGVVYNLGLFQFPPALCQYPQRQPREMVKIVDNTEPRIMCFVVKNPKGRGMCHIIEEKAGTLEQRNRAERRSMFLHEP